MAIQQLLNNSKPNDFEELLFWGKVSGINADYYIALGVCYTDRYEFAEKKFYWCYTDDMTFKAFPTLNKQHETLYDSLANL